MNDVSRNSPSSADWKSLATELDGELHTGDLMRRIYATDASAYQEVPAAVAIPTCENDIATLIRFAGKHQIGLIPRTAGTSLAGQVVGSGIVVDVSRHFTRIVEVNTNEGWVRVQPGVIRNELNAHLAPLGFWFAPETSTQNRAMIGGMVGNNSCGSNSIKFGSTRDHLLEVRGFLSDGSEATFADLSRAQFVEKCDAADSLEARLYRHARERLTDPVIREEITREFPNPSILRRNTGYAIDVLMDSDVLTDAALEQDGGINVSPFNFCRLIAGSEGTLFFATEIKLRILPLRPPCSGLMCAHFSTVTDALNATLIAVRHDIDACELIDDVILKCTQRSIEHRQNRFFIQGEPAAILVTEVRGQTDDEVRAIQDRIAAEMKAAGLGYHFPVLFGDEGERVWDLRKAGLGLLGNIPGDEKTVPVIEDTAVDVRDLPAYIAEVNELLRKRFGLECVQYAHAGSGEIHLRPIINLKTAEGKLLFRSVASEIVTLVKKYRGSLSGEHGDGRLRGEFLKQMIGDANYQLVREFKKTWDPGGVFNPNKIVDTPQMNTSLRYEPGQTSGDGIETVFDFSSDQGILRAAEMCNGSGDCRKTHLTGGVMCPSYMATRNEKDTTRARANTLRQILTSSEKSNPFDSEEIRDVMDLCLSCKGCKSECPSTVDMGKMKAEFLQHYYDANGVPRRTRMIAGYVRAQSMIANAPALFNALVGVPAIRRTMNRLIGFHPDRSIPKAARQTFRNWFQTRPRQFDGSGSNGRKVWIFADEFTQYGEPGIGIAVVELLERLGYEVGIPDHIESGRSSLSKGLLRNAREIAKQNVAMLREVVSEQEPLIGIEPSAILSFRDEYPQLVGEAARDDAVRLSENCFLFDEWLAREIEAGHVTSEAFVSDACCILVHGHCHQKALASMSPTIRILQLPANYTASLIRSGCCGMAGSFGYEREHYDVSMKIGELVLLPAVRAAEEDTILAVAGTSCRHQILDGTGKHAKHPAEILRDALRGE
ncbi:FAD-binding and (Fe-S)-binding domain-containing protein [Rhodopirellula sp. SWK7]|uniref:FAD-binding and (Fe-S)-binding domain-containing protein n=1 Tax=Rhodopirellula sp. SWK7 TaxID=595460 RepID=UPI0002BE07F3|nr:FAD-binding and (Fe-S)-binding domain-containing protein [Rhodopirellula sp. SWK7]EMI46474.1 FAD linked oxidase domain-containing protein [Rhodopirellula sp. SWK7]